MQTHLTAAHWVYLGGIVLILVTMILRKNIVVPAVVATFVTGVVFSHSAVTGLKVIFNGSLVAATNLFNIFLIIALVSALLGSLKALGADVLMVRPFRGLMRNGHISFWLLAAVTYVISLFFWPTPATPLIGAVLIPVAIRAGLSPLGVGAAVAIAGQGMALSSDYVIRVAPGLSAKAAQVDADTVAWRSMVLSLIVGGAALVIAYLFELRRIRRPSEQWLADWEELEDPSAPRAAAVPLPRGAEVAALATVGAATAGGAATTAPPRGSSPAAGGGGEPEEESVEGFGGLGHGALMNVPGGRAPVARGPFAPVFAVLVPLAFLALIVYMIVAAASPGVADLNGGDAAALIGGVATILTVLATLAQNPRKMLELSSDRLVEGLVFAFKAMGVVLPIAAFFFIGNGEYAASILGLPDGATAPQLLVDLVTAAEAHIPHVSLLTAFGVLLVGIVAGLEGSGFSGLPLTGALSGALGHSSGVDPATLAAIGQMGNIWSGGGVLVAWSSLVAVAGFARVPVVDLARRCFLPVIAGLVLSVFLAVLLF